MAELANEERREYGERIGRMATRGLSADEFERQYARRSGITVAKLRELGRIVRACDCGDGSCEGWRSTTEEREREGMFNKA